jgi:hypothetical protein
VKYKRKLSLILLLSLLPLLTMSAVQAAPSAGLLRGKLPDKETEYKTIMDIKLTDGNDGTAGLYNYNGVSPTWTLSNTTTITGIYFKPLDGYSKLDLLDSSDKVLATYQNQKGTPNSYLTVNIKGVKKVKVYAVPSYGTYTYEVDVQGTSEAPPKVSRPVPLVTGINSVSAKVVLSNYNGAKTVNSSDLLPYMYEVAINLHN